MWDIFNIFGGGGGLVGGGGGGRALVDPSVKKPTAKYTQSLNLTPNLLKPYVEAAVELSGRTINGLKADEAMAGSQAAFTREMDAMTRQLTGHDKCAAVFNASQDGRTCMDFLKATYWSNYASNILAPADAPALAQVASQIVTKHWANIKESQDAVTTLLAEIKDPNHASRPNPMSSCDLLTIAKANILYSMDELHKTAKIAALDQMPQAGANVAIARTELESQLDKVHAARKKAVEESFNADITSIQKLNATNMANVVLLSRLSNNKKNQEQFVKLHKTSLENVDEAVGLGQQETRFSIKGVHVKNLTDPMYSSIGTKISITGPDDQKTLSFSYGRIGKALTRNSTFWKNIESDVLDMALYLKAQGNESVTFSIRCPAKEEEETVRRTYAKLLEAGFEPHQINIEINGKSYVGGLQEGKESKSSTVESVFFKDHAALLESAKNASTKMSNPDTMDKVLGDGSLRNQIDYLRQGLKDLQAPAVIPPPVVGAAGPGGP